MRTAQQDAHLAGAHLCEKLLFLNIGFCIVDERHLIRCHPSGDEFLPDVLIDGKGLFLLQRNRVFQHMQRGIIQLISHAPLLGGSGLRRADIAENELCQFLTVSLAPIP